MFSDMLDMFVVGTEVMCKGEKYLVVGSVNSVNPGLYFAVKPNTSFPTQVYVIRDDKVAEKKETKEPINV